jgi:hypothetical protein
MAAAALRVTLAVLLSALYVVDVSGLGLQGSAGLRARRSGGPVEGARGASIGLTWSALLKCPTAEPVAGAPCSMLRLRGGAKSKNHTNHNQNHKAHRNGIKRVKRSPYPPLPCLHSFPVLVQHMPFHCAAWAAAARAG